MTTLYLRNIIKNFHASNELSNYSFSEDGTEAELFGANSAGISPGDDKNNTYIQIINFQNNN